MPSKRQFACVITTLLTTFCIEALGLPAGTAFTYQGRLKLDGAPVNGTADFEFALWDAATGGSQLGSIVPASAVNIADGVFTVELDFGVGVFTGDPRWREIDGGDRRGRCAYNAGTAVARVAPGLNRGGRDSGPTGLPSQSGGGER